MHILALGGLGAVGQQACRVVAQFDFVSQLIVADLSRERADAFAKELGPRARGTALDATDPNALRAALDGVDIVMNTAGPFFRHGTTVLAAAIERGCHYIDVCDDWEPTLEMLALHDAAERAGVTAIIGMGASPGLSNLLACAAARELDAPDELITGWNIEAAQVKSSRASASVSAALVHGMRQMTGKIRVYRDGRFADDKPLQKHSVRYPGIGRRTVWTFGHPEPLTLPRIFPTLRRCLNVVHGRRPFILLARALRWLIQYRILSQERAAHLAAWFDARSTPVTVNTVFEPKRLPPLFAYAVGQHAGQKAIATATLVRAPGLDMAQNTGVPLAVGLELLARGEVTKHGVLAPEEAFDPVRVFERYADFCVVGMATDDVFLVTRSWDGPSEQRLRHAVLSPREAS